MLSEGEGEGAGSGGVTRGRGDADMTWGAESNGDTERFEAKTLPSAEYRDPEHSAVVGVGAAAPTVEPVAEGAGLTGVEASAGRAAWKRRLAPHHRRAVQTYFTRESAQKQ
ncbi:MAG: hypothetical protein JNL28_11165 [Planctomycetes bacterium]|nr:hypothetical protein [Planctomycetota bacterium]